MRVANHPGAPLVPNRPFKLSGSFNLGVFGGMLGGFVAGTIVLLQYMWNSDLRKYFGIMYLTKHRAGVSFVA